MKYAKPTVGKQVRVTVRHPSFYIYRTEEFKESTYLGTVLPDNKWTPEGGFEMTGTEDSRIPLRQVLLKNVTNIEYLDGSQAAKAPLETKAPDEQVWQVAGSKGNTYTVIKRNGKVTCTCPGFTFRGTCRHSKDK